MKPLIQVYLVTSLSLNRSPTVAWIVEKIALKQLEKNSIQFRTKNLLTLAFYLLIAKWNQVQWKCIESNI